MKEQDDNQKRHMFASLWDIARKGFSSDGALVPLLLGAACFGIAIFSAVKVIIEFTK